MQTENTKLVAKPTTTALERLNVKQEAFCQEMAMGAKRDEAYVAAGYGAKNVKTAVARLLKQTKITARIAQLEASGFGSLSPIQLIRRLGRVADQAEALGSAAALAVARAALMDIARVNGLTRAEEGQLGSTMTVVLADRPLSEDEWESLHPPLG